jgi:hypothetical protein
VSDEEVLGVNSPIRIAWLLGCLACAWSSSIESVPSFPARLSPITSVPIAALVPQVPFLLDSEYVEW